MSQTGLVEIDECLFQILNREFHGEDFFCSFSPTDYSFICKHHEAFCLISSVHLSIILTDKKGLRADPWCNHTGPWTHLSAQLHTSLLFVCHHSCPAPLKLCETLLPLLTSSLCDGTAPKHLCSANIIAVVLCVCGFHSSSESSHELSCSTNNIYCLLSLD